MWEGTNYPGVYVRGRNAKHGILKDSSLSIRFQFNGKSYQEVVGRASEGNTPKKAFLILSELKNNQRHGAGPVTLKEKRTIEQERKEIERVEKQVQEKAGLSFSILFTDHYLPQQQQDKKKSWNGENIIYKNHIQPVIGEMRLADIAPIHLERIKSNMTKKGLSARSIHYCLAITRQVFNFATKRDFFSGGNPVSKVKKPTADNRRMRFLSHDEAQRLLDEIRVHSVLTYHITLISLHCGLRFGEIAGLTWQDLNFQTETILIRNPKNGQTRHAFMTDALKAMFLEMEPGKGNAFVFLNTGKNERMSQIPDTFMKAVNKLGLNKDIDDSRLKVVFHTCRHSFASWLVADGADLFTVRELMGHKSIQMTARYSHFSPHTLRRAVDSMEAAMQAGQEQGGQVVRLRK